MSENLQINATARGDLGKAATRRLRLTDRVPGIIYGGDGEPVAFSTGHIALRHSLEQEAFAASVLTLDLDGVTEQVVLKDLQRHPYKLQIMHVDLLRVSQTTELHMTIPLHFTGEDIAPGVKDSGGLVSHSVTEVAIACLPKDLPEFLVVDVSQLEEGHALHLSDVQLPDGVVIPELSLGPDHDIPVVSIHIPRAIEIEDDEGEASEGEGEGDGEGEDEGGE